MSRYKDSIPALTKRQLFEVKDDSPNVFTIGEFHRGWSPFALGYKHAADVLVEALIDRDWVTEVVCLPVLFLYRQYAELSLKGMLVDAGELLYTDDQPPGIHPLVPLWNDLRTRIAKIEGTDSGGWMNRAEVLIRELDSFDPTSYTFRYPVNKKGEPNLPSFRVDIGHFRDVMDELEMVLNGIAAWLGNIVDMKHEMESDAGYDGYE